MRIISEFETQFKFGQASLSTMVFNLFCRDDITKFLLGLQHLYNDRKVMKKILEFLESNIPVNNIGRPGMSLWRIFVLSLLRQTINADYDRLCNLANNHRELRDVLGHSIIDSEDYYSLQTIKDNVGLLTDELMNSINLIIVHAGRSVLDKRLTSELNIKSDSFVVESNIHYPTDSNLLLDAMRSMVNKIKKLSLKNGIKGWRQGEYRIKLLKKLMRKATNLKRSTSKNPDKQEKRQVLIEATYSNFINECRTLLIKAQDTLSNFLQKDTISAIERDMISGFMVHAERQIDQLHRRIILKETIPHSEKVFSVYEDYVEWVCKGKAGVPVELGLKVCISSDQHGFILNHQVMQNQQDADIAVSIIDELKKEFTRIDSASFDGGFYSKANKEALEKKVGKLVMRKKGKLSQKEKDCIKSDSEYIKLRKKHSAVESDINAIEVHALDRCPDKGLKHFKRYVSSAIVAYNIHKIGALAQQKQQKQEKKLRVHMPTAA